MTRGAAALLVAAIVSFGATTARGQPAIVGVQDADPPLDDAPPPEWVAPHRPAESLCVCGCRLVPAPLEPTENELTGVIVGGATAAIVSYFLATLYAADQSHGLRTVDTIPVFGAIAAAQRNPLDDRTTPLLLFSAGVQAIGILVAAVAGADLAARRRLMIDASASPYGVGMGATWRY